MIFYQIERLGGDAITFTCRAMILATVIALSGVAAQAPDIIFNRVSTTSDDYQLGVVRSGIAREVGLSMTLVENGTVAGLWKATLGEVDMVGIGAPHYLDAFDGTGSYSEDPEDLREGYKIMKAILALPVGMNIAPLDVDAPAWDRRMYSRAAVLVLGFSTLLTLLFSGYPATYSGLIASSVSVIAAITSTGLGIKLKQKITALGDQKLLAALVFASVCSIVLGTGLPTAASYLMAIFVAGPTMIELGISELSTHMFDFYYAVLSAITPPVALAIFAAAAIAEENPIQLAMTSLPLAAVGFVLPIAPRDHGRHAGHGRHRRADDHTIHGARDLRFFGGACWLPVLQTQHSVTARARGGRSLCHGARLVDGLPCWRRDTCHLRSQIQRSRSCTSHLTGSGFLT